MTRRCLAFSVFAAGAALAAGSGPPAGSGGGGTGVTGVTPAGAIEIRTLSERVPAGGSVQVKFLPTQPRPITSGGWGIATDSFSVAGVSINSPLGDTVGTAVAHNGMLYLSVISPNSDFGTNVDYPL